MDIESVKAVIEVVRSRMKLDYKDCPTIVDIVDETCDTIILQLEAKGA